MFENMKAWMTPERAAAFQGIGLGLSQLGAGQPVNLSPVYDALEQRKQAASMRKVMDIPGVMDGFTPQQRAVLAAMPEQLATKIIMEQAFKAQEPIAGINVGGALVNPYTGEVMYTGPQEQPTPTDDMREYELAKAQGYTGTFQDYMLEMKKAGAASTSVTVGGETGPQAEIGTIPQGYVAVPDPNSPAGYTMVPIPGGPEDTTKADAAAKDNVAKTADIVLGKLDELDSLLKGSSWYNPVTGLGAETAAGVGGTKAADARAIIDTIEANVAFDALSAMRKASPTGGALGAISERELTLLGATLSSLKQSQSPEQFAASVAQLRDLYSGIMEKAAAYPNAVDFGFGTGKPDGLTDEDLKYLGVP